MNIFEFKQTYPDLISEFEKKNPGRKAIGNEGLTKNFLVHLQQNNIKINYKLPKILIPKRYHYVPHISEFWLKFLQNHAYFSKNIVIDDYIHEYYSPKNKCGNIKRDFNNLIRYFLKYGIIEHYSRDTYKINKELVRKYE